MNRPIALVALLGFLLSLGVHVTALLGIDVSEKMPFVWGLHVGIFAVFIPFVFSIRKILGDKPTLIEFRKLIPGWVATLMFMLMGYTFINFALFMLATEGGSPIIHDGKFILQNHGHLIRELSSTEYAAFRANELRGFSGHWLMFYFVPFAFFMFHDQPDSLMRRAALKNRPPSEPFE